MDLDHLHITRMIKRNGKLEYLNPKDKDFFINRVGSMRENQVVEMITDFANDSGKLSQISRVHMLIGKISKFTGDTDEAVKKEVKEIAGLYKPTEDLRSFKHCSQEDLEFAIECAIALGSRIGMNLR